MSAVWKTIRSYIWWTFPRGSVQYDVMVTLILLFVFLAPRWINFKDKPPANTPHPTEVVVHSDGKGGSVYEVAAADVTGQDDAAIRAALHRIIEPIAGDVELLRYEMVRDARGKPISYKVWVKR